MVGAVGMLGLGRKGERVLTLLETVDDLLKVRQKDVGDGSIGITAVNRTGLAAGREVLKGSDTSKGTCLKDRLSRPASRLSEDK